VLAGALVFLIAASTAIAASDPLVQEDSGTVVNWRRGIVAATAGAAPDHRTPSAEVARAGAERRARASARARIGEALRKLPLGGGRKLDELAVTRAIERARVAELEYQSNGGVMVTMEVAFGTWAASASASASEKPSRPDGGSADDDGAAPPSRGAPTALSLSEGRLGAAPVVVVGGREVEPSAVRYATGAPPPGGPRPAKAKLDKKGRLIIEAGAPGEFAARPLLIYVHKILR
jgi:hypothetical protein